MLFKDISYLEIWQPVRGSGTVCTVLIEGIMKDNSVKYILN